MIAVLDFGGQYAHLIARRLRDLKAKAKVFRFDFPASELAAAKGIIFSGGPNSAYQENAPKPDEKIFSLEKPILGLCYGHQYLSLHFGGKVERSDREYGEKIVKVIKKEGILAGLKDEEKAWFSHGDSVVQAPDGFVVLAKNNDSITAFQKGNIFGLQFHPEVVHTPCGSAILENFAFSVCKEEKQEKTFQTNDIIQGLKEKVGNEKVVIGVSGGVDSTVAALLLKKAIGSQLYPIFIDNGFMRQGEVEEVKRFYKDFPNFIAVDAGKEFVDEIKGINDPEEKRKRIGHLFIRVFEKAASQINASFFAQGTIFSDRVESAATSGLAAKIKSHHNLTLPKMNWLLIEPLAELYKDEVRELGRELGVPNEVLKRHPFPGPGLSINVIGEVTGEKLKMVRQADAIFMEELKKSGWHSKVFEAFAAILPCKVVGVKGDERSFEYPIVLRAVESKDVMTADWAKLPHSLLQQTATRILNEVEGVNRVFYDVTQKPPGTIRYE